MKLLGPTFGDEVISAGLGGLPFTWGNDDTQINSAQLTAQQKTTLDAVVAAHDPNAVSPLANKVDIILLKIAFNHENRIRVLEGKAPITMAQFKTALNALLA